MELAPGKKRYRKRYQRTKGEADPIRIQEGDIAILELLANYRCMDLYMIQAATGRGLDALKKRLGKLYRNGLLDRPRIQRYRYHMKTPGAMIYALGNQGGQLLVQQGKLERVGDLTRNNSEMGLPYLEHQLMIGRFRIALAKALESIPKVELVDWQPSAFLRVETVVDGERRALIPDGHLALDMEGKGRLHFFLEMDRGTMTTRRFAEKIRAYLAWYHSRGHQEEFKMPSFQVLTVTPGSPRRDSLIDATYEVTQGRDPARFLFAAEACKLPGCPGCNPRSEEDKGQPCPEGFTIAHPENILRQWYTTADDKPHDLVQLK